MPRSGIPGSYGGFSPSFFRNLQTIFHSRCINLHSHQQCKSIPFSLHHLQHLLFVDFLMMPVLTDVYSCLGNSMDRGAWQATVYWLAREWDMTERPNNTNSLEVELERRQDRSMEAQVAPPRLGGMPFLLFSHFFTTSRLINWFIVPHSTVLGGLASEKVCSLISETNGLWARMLLLFTNTPKKFGVISFWIWDSLTLLVVQCWNLPKRMCFYIINNCVIFLCVCFLSSIGL